MKIYEIGILSGRHHLITCGPSFSEIIGFSIRAVYPIIPHPHANIPILRTAFFCARYCGNHPSLLFCQHGIDSCKCIGLCIRNIGRGHEFSRERSGSGDQMLKFPVAESFLQQIMIIVPVAFILSANLSSPIHASSQTCRQGDGQSSSQSGAYSPSPACLHLYGLAFRKQ